MITLHCTQRLLERLRIPADAESDAVPRNALGDWTANLVRAGRDQLVVAMSECSFLTLVFPAREVRASIASELPRVLGLVLRELEVPIEVIERELGAMHPLAYSRTHDRSLVASLNERARITELLWRDGRAPMDIMLQLASMPFIRGPMLADGDPSRAARRLLGLDPEPAPPANVIRLHVALDGLSPPIWRRLVVPEAIALPRLHRALQLAMGWEDRHLHEFDFGGERYGVPDPDFPDASVRDEREVRLGDVLRRREVGTFTYLYDFGDDWSHTVQVEAVEPNAGGVRGVACTGGANRCPPEDVGGPPGYLDLIHALHDPAHERYRELLAWLGEPFHPRFFDVELTNALLRVGLGK